MAIDSKQSQVTNTGTAILGRLIAPEEASFAPDAARSLLQLQFPTEDQERVNDLSTKAQKGTLSPVERTELEEYLRVADLLAMLKSKARLSLQKASETPNTP